MLLVPVAKIVLNVQMDINIAVPPINANQFNVQKDNILINYLINVNHAQLIASYAQPLITVKIVTQGMLILNLAILVIWLYVIQVFIIT